MLEWISTPYGEIIPKFNGNLLASKIDPQKEAKIWVESTRSQIESAKKHFLLGVGAGHHALELSRQYPERDFIFIEKLESLSASPVYVEIRVMSNVELLIGQDEKQILKNERVQRALGDLFTVLAHSPSRNISTEYYSRVLATLTARNWKAFNQVLKFRSEDEKVLNEINFTPKSENVISAKDIINFVSDHATKSEAEMIWMTLGELIK